ncbi:uncharacterized protein BDV14DRAFT_182286 [Aspergillus stella-maris]|uniref:uncharacterized protein n=1 Tax=Aspergillus stella-maris TaxID=1810926 RepID=UPI003CCD7D29
MYPSSTDMLKGVTQSISCRFGSAFLRRRDCAAKRLLSFTAYQSGVRLRRSRTSISTLSLLRSRWIASGSCDLIAWCKGAWRFLSLALISIWPLAARAAATFTWPWATATPKGVILLHVSATSICMPSH